MIIGGNTMAKRKWSSEEVEKYRKEHNQYVIYFTKDDANFLVHKKNGSSGRTERKLKGFFFYLYNKIVVIN